MTKEELVPVTDKVAEELERAGLYRRAATRWLEVFFECAGEAERTWISRRRRECLARQRVFRVDDDGYLNVYRAVRDLHSKMGLDHSIVSGKYRTGRRRS
ncbi:TPA: PerC family transcriptional regulator [Klebsiella pneumoniae]|nr:PerC family transcriptional regulator [Klebsiella pneumoniae]